MSTTRKHICPACKRLCALTDGVCLSCHTSLHHARVISVPVEVVTRDHPLNGERLVVIPPVTAHADDEYLNLFRRPKLYRIPESYQYPPSDVAHVQQLVRMAFHYQYMGFVALIAMVIALTCALTMTVCRAVGWEVAWLPPPHLWDTIVPLGYAFTLLQICATYTALRARDHALYLADLHQKNLAAS